jgi:aerobic-type carbon monoxide dehydrogenase small subunit (CoxS/CutS family)
LRDEGAPTGAVGHPVVVALTVNGEERRVLVEPRRLLSDVLRDDLGLTGTHVGCEHGVCGACTVLLDGEPVRSCLLFAAQLEGARITTVEGITPPGGLHPLQVAFRERHALQCGYCTPGMLITAYDLLARHPSPSEAEIREAISGNLCRCTGYEPIVAAVRLAADRMGGAAGEGGQGSADA